MTPAEPMSPGYGLARLGSADLNLLVPLLAFLEERSVTRAAERVGLSQPAMSHALRRLRQLLGDQLLVRQGGAMVLTPHAEELISPVRRALHEASGVLTPAPFDPGTDDRTITVALTTTTTFVFAPLLMAVLAERAPHVTLRLRTSDMASPTIFTDDGVDVVLLPQAFRSPYPRKRLYDDRLVILASPAVPADRTPMELLSEEPHILFDAGPTFHSRGYAILNERHIPYEVHATVSDYLLVPHLLSASRTVTLHRYQVGVKFRDQQGLRMEEFPFPVSLGIDIVWNPWLADDTFRTWLHATLLDAAAPLRGTAPADLV